MNKDFELDLKIDIDNPKKLMEQLQKVAHQYWEIGKVYEKSKKITADLKLQLRIKESEIATELRNTHTKISEARINSSFFDYQDYIELNKEYNTAKYNESYLSSMLEALKIKHSVMLTVASLLKAELRQII